MTDLQKKCLEYCNRYYDNAEQLNVFFHSTDFTIYRNGIFLEQVFYSDIEEK